MARPYFSGLKIIDNNINVWMCENIVQNFLKYVELLKGSYTYFYFLRIWAI